MFNPGVTLTPSATTGLVTLTAGFGLAAATRTNLLEDNQESLPITGQQVQFPIRPYEIVTLRLVTRG